LFLAGFCLNGSGQNKVDSLFEDIRFRNDTARFFTAKTVDFIRVKSTVSEGVKFAAVIYKPDKPSPVLLLSHGWHQSVMPPSQESENPYPRFLSVQMDMRRRKFSTGKHDCNGLEYLKVGNNDFLHAHQLFESTWLFA